LGLVVSYFDFIWNTPNITSLIYLPCKMRATL
jgi:hypothetical protein